MASFEKAHQVLKKSCMPCHSMQLPLPWYGRMPLAKQVMKKEYLKSIEKFDLDAEVYVAGEPPALEVLNKLEKVVVQGSMPPLDYKIRHLGSSLSKKEKQAILNWIHDERLHIVPPAPAPVQLPAIEQPAAPETKLPEKKEKKNPFKPLNL